MTLPHFSYSIFTCRTVATDHSEQGGTDGLAWLLLSELSATGAAQAGISTLPFPADKNPGLKGYS